MPYLHHVAIHFPIALAMLAALGSIVAWIRGDWFRDARRLLSYLVTLSALVAATSGLLSAAHVAGEIEDSKVARHRNVALTAASIAILTGLLGFVGARKRSSALVRTSEVGSIVTAAAIGLAGHFGGDMLHPGLTPWSTEPHSHGMKHEHSTAGDHDDEHMTMAMPDAGADSIADAAEPNNILPDAGSTTDAHTHSHGPTVDPNATTTAKPSPTPTAPPAPTPAPTPTPTPPPPMTGMPSGHKM